MLRHYKDFIRAHAATKLGHYRSLGRLYVGPERKWRVASGEDRIGISALSKEVKENTADTLPGRKRPDAPTESG
jgi:hypothetical protein